MDNILKTNMFLGVLKHKYFEDTYHDMFCPSSWLRCVWEGRFKQKSWGIGRIYKIHEIWKNYPIVLKIVYTIFLGVFHAVYIGGWLISGIYLLYRVSERYG